MCRARTKDKPWNGVGRCAREGDGEGWQQPEEGSVAKLGEGKGEKGDEKELLWSGGGEKRVESKRRRSEVSDERQREVD